MITQQIERTQMTNIVYIVGEPASGKTTLMSQLIPERGEMFVPEGFPTVKLEEVPGGWHLGETRGLFSGTDAMSMSAAPVVRRWLATLPEGTVWGEGKRLSSTKVLDVVLQRGGGVYVVHLHAEPEEIAERKIARGSEQAEVFCIGVRTTAANIARWATETPGVHCLSLRSDASTADAVREWLTGFGVL